jgi:tRNA G37 N-methylase Trm5
MRVAQQISYAARRSLTETPGSAQEGRRTSARRVCSATKAMDSSAYIHVVLCDKWKSSGLMRYRDLQFVA